MREQVRSAFLAIREGFSPDRVVADPDLNKSFIARCRSLGLSQTEECLNHVLLNMRKGGGLAGFRTSQPTRFRDESDYAFASEIAIRYLERRDGVTLDQVICSPDRAAEFDAVATRICPGYSVLQYRWAALGLRKGGKLKPEMVGRVCSYADVKNLPVHELDLEEIPTGQGVYLFFTHSETLYVGESANLRKRLAKHLEHSDNKGLARWLWDRGTDDMHLEMHVLPTETKTMARKAVERELIRSRTPLFNVAGR